MLTKYFKLQQNNTTVKTEILAGITTFMTMAYILIVNPIILSKTGMDFNALITATALSAAVATLVMALWAKLPFALAPGMGLNAFFAYTVVIGMGHSWQFALTAIFLEGIIFLLLTAFNIREAIIDAIPQNIKHAISVGIGLFIAFIGLVNASIIQSGMQHVGDNKLDGLIVKLGSLSNGPALLALIGLILTATLIVTNVRGALLIGIIISTLIGIPMGVTTIPNDFSPLSLPPSLSPIFFKLDFSQIFSLDMLIVLFTFLFVDMFDTVGTLIGVSSKANILTHDGKIPRVKQALFADAIGTTTGAILGTSTVTTYVESASGVAEGGKTGLTAFTIAILFLLSLFIAPLLAIIPSAATSPALILVGLFMITPITKIDLHDYSEAIPAFLTIIMMPLTYSIADGIVFGMLSYILLKLLTGRIRELSIATYCIGAIFLIKFMI